MRLTLTIENFSRRPDGGPLTYVAEGRRSVDIGRYQHLDFCLPDENHFISGRHCEISPKDGAYDLTDFSTNGTYVNSPDRLVQSPYRLRDGDRLFIGDYVIAVHIEEDAGAPRVMDEVTDPPPPSHDEFWRPSEPAPPHIDLTSWVDPPPNPHVDWIDRAAIVPMSEAPSPLRPLEPSRDEGSVWWDEFEPPPQARPEEGSPRMRLTLMVENFSRKPDGGPLTYIADGRRSIKIGRDQHLDFCLPDENRFISGYHCVISLNDGAYELTDASKNGTFVNSPDCLVESPYRLHDGDRLFIGDYIIAVHVHMDETPNASKPPYPPGPEPVNPEKGNSPHDPQDDRINDVVENREPTPLCPVTAADGYDAFLSGFARALGLRENADAEVSPDELGERLGALTRLVTEGMRQLLHARAEAKRQMRNANHTIIEAQGNNPLKFAPTTDEALRMLLGEPRPGFLDAQRAFFQAFDDLKKHQICTYAAMQDAVRMIGAGLSPATIERGLTDDTGLAAIVASRKARLWDRYVERWDAMSTRSDDKLSDAFRRNFAECYDRVDTQKKID